jgi:hypothetical protein
MSNVSLEAHIHISNALADASQHANRLEWTLRFQGHRRDV